MPCRFHRSPIQLSIHEIRQQILPYHGFFLPLESEIVTAFMIYVSYPFNQVQRLSFYLATEEFLARYRKEEELFFLWQVRPTVIIGRNQLLEKEVNLPYCQSHGIDVIRRKSGGGCVYADMSNVMFSYINYGENVTFTFDHYIQLVLNLLHKLGIAADTSGRNDILIEGKKVSGNAFYHISHRNIVHGTMLYDTHIENMVRSITPSQEKLVSKGVESVREHITFLKDYTRLTLEQFKQQAKGSLCDEEIILSAKEIQIIRQIEQEYLDNRYFLGNNPKYSLIRRGRVEGCGEVELRFDIRGEKIQSASISGDYFPIGDLDKEFLPSLKDVPFTQEGLSLWMEKTDPSKYINHLSKTDFYHLIFNSDE